MPDNLLIVSLTPDEAVLLGQIVLARVLELMKLPATPSVESELAILHGWLRKMVPSVQEKVMQERSQWN